MNAVPASERDALISGTHVFAGTPLMLASTLVQFAPPSRVTCTRPSSVPAQTTPRSIGLGASAMIVVKFSAPVTSKVRPPLFACCCHSFLFEVRSGLMVVHDSPRFADLCTNWLPKYTPFGSNG